jgi:nicotinamide mononucleotide adenylyltransferase
MTMIRDILDREAAEESTLEESIDLSSNPNNVNALSSVMNYIITDAFNLSTEESMWVGYHLGNILSPLNNIIPSALMGAVKQEMSTREYSNRLFKRGEVSSLPETEKSGVRYAPIENWVESLSEVVLSSYPNLRPMIKSSIIGSIHGLLTELGINSTKKSRGSLYLPNAVRHLLGNR